MVVAKAGEQRFFSPRLNRPSDGVKRPPTSRDLLNLRARCEGGGETAGVLVAQADGFALLLGLVEEACDELGTSSSRAASIKDDLPFIFFLCSFSFCASIARKRAISASTLADSETGVVVSRRTRGQRGVMRRRKYLERTRRILLLDLL